MQCCCAAVASDEVVPMLWAWFVHDARSAAAIAGCDRRLRGCGGARARARARARAGVGVPAVAERGQDGHRAERRGAEQRGRSE